MNDEIFKVILPLVGTVIGALIGYLTAVKVSDRKEFQKAALDFYDAFTDTLLSLDQKYYCGDKETDVCEIIRKTFPQQIKAMLKFRLYLPSDKVEKFDKAWNEYVCYDCENGPFYPFLEQYSNKVSGGQENSKMALPRIYCLLSFVDVALKSPFNQEYGTCSNSQLYMRGKKNEL